MVNYHPDRTEHYHSEKQQADYSNATWTHPKRPWFWRPSGWNFASDSNNTETCHKCKASLNTKGCTVQDKSKIIYFYPCCMKNNKGCKIRHLCCNQDLGAVGCKTGELAAITTKVLKY